MICILLKNIDLAKKLRAQFTRIRVKSKIIPFESTNFLEALYGHNVIAAIVEEQLPDLPLGVSADLLNSLGQRIPVIVIGVRREALSDQSIQDFHMSDDITILYEPTTAEIVSTLSASGALGDRPGRASRRSVPYYNPQIPISMMQKNNGIAMLAIDASDFRKIEIKFGTDVYSKVKEVFQRILNNLWGKPGAIRNDDILCRRSVHGNIYYIFLCRSRQSRVLPLPGMLERIAERLNRMIQNSLWEELNAPGTERQIPACVTTLPAVTVGFASSIFNPCLDSGEIIQTMIESSMKTAMEQSQRLRLRLKELMQTLIQSDEILDPNFQGVFLLQELTKEQVKSVQIEKSIRSIKHILYGFESLIRVRQKKLEKVLSRQGSQPVEANYLNPLVLFSIADQTQVALELDQACLLHAARKSLDLPGYLMVNILPRNLYFVDRLVHLFEQRSNIIFEVSESEAINNFELMAEVRLRLKQEQMGIAADDFGKGFAGLERVIKMSPDLIKFDRSLIQDIHIDKVKQAYVKGLVDAARLLKTKVLAEGVELWEEAEVLKEMGIDLIQGFLLHRPQEVEEILEQIYDFTSTNSQVSAA